MPPSSPPLFNHSPTQSRSTPRRTLQSLDRTAASRRHQCCKSRRSGQKHSGREPCPASCTAHGPLHRAPHHLRRGCFVRCHGLFLNIANHRVGAQPDADDNDALDRERRRCLAGVEERQDGRSPAGPHTCGVVRGLHANVGQREDDEAEAQQRRGAVVQGAVALPLNDNTANLSRERGNRVGVRDVVRCYCPHPRGLRAVP